jgi:4,5-DOPA dioxygenase extradiol
MNRRDFLGATTALLLAPEVVLAKPAAAMPSLFFAHGAPFLATNNIRGKQLRDLAGGLPRLPRGIVAITPHVRAEYVSLAAHGVARRSFPRRFIERVGDIQYTPPPAETLAHQLRGLLATAQVPLATQEHDAFDHTIWMGLLHMFPAANIPVVEMAMPFMPPERLFKIGQALAPLCDEDVLIISSGALTHNLAALFEPETPSWAIEFDQWIGATLDAGDIDAVLDWRSKAPAADIAHPDDGGHFNVMLYALGAAAGSKGTIEQASAADLDFEFGSFSTRDYLFS